MTVDGVSRRVVGLFTSVVALLGLGVATGGEAAGVANGGWTLESIPLSGSIDRLGELDRVTCPSDSFCMAVGYYIGPNGYGEPLAEEWDGSQWSILPTPSPARGGGLGVVSCVGASFCMAAGQGTFEQPTDVSTGPAFAERWNGSAWTKVAVPAGIAVAGLSCASTTLCMAVGSGRLNGHVRSVAWRWNGTAWTRSRPAVFGTTAFTAVACPTVRQCFAVGYRTVTNTPYNTMAVIDHWNGSAWSSTASSFPAHSSLYDVACPSAGYCTGVGRDETGAGYDGFSAFVVDRSGKSTWTHKAFGAGIELHDVSCSAPRICEATTITSGDTGDTYTLVSRGKTGGFQSDYRDIGEYPTSISCPTTTCTVAGFNPEPNPTGGQDPQQPSIGRGKGTVLKYATLPQIPTLGQGRLVAVSCVSSGFCAAASDGATDGGTAPIYLRTDGQWHASDTSTSLLGPNSYGAVSVSCLSSTFCMTVGYTSSEWWNGETWTPAAMPVPPGVSTDYFDSVSCLSPTSCVAVGGNYRNSPLTELWNGTTWSRLTTPAPTGTYRSSLDSVSCLTTTTYCMAVGNFTLKGQHPTHALYESWDGNKWTMLAVDRTPPPATPYEGDRVSCVSSTFCMALLAQDPDTYGPARLERWNGSAWSRTPLAQPGPVSWYGIYGLSCSTSKACTVIGGQGSANVVEQWNGVKWAIVAAPDEQPNHTFQPAAISCPTAKTCVAVGQSNRTTEVPLVAQMD